MCGETRILGICVRGNTQPRETHITMTPARQKIYSSQASKTIRAKFLAVRPVALSKMNNNNNYTTKY